MKNKEKVSWTIDADLVKKIKEDVNKGEADKESQRANLLIKLGYAALEYFDENECG